MIFTLGLGVTYLISKRGPVLSQGKKAKIETSLIKLFVCCEFSWRLVEHPFFVEFVKQLHSSYEPPNRKTLAGTLLDDEILRVHTKIYRILEKQNNLTLGKLNFKLHYLFIYLLIYINLSISLYAALDGWTSPTGKSLWNFVIHTSDGKDILWCIQDLSDQSHTAEYLAQKIESVLSDIGIQNFAAIVTDAGSNINLARQIITQKYPHIVNIRCMAHCLNLITKDFIKHAFETLILNWSNVITTYFKKSHLPQSLLEDKIKEKNIRGGGVGPELEDRENYSNY